MRTLTSKLILAFLIVSLTSTGVFVVLTHFATNREFNRFISERNTTELSEELAQYYSENGSWKGVNSAFIGRTAQQYRAPDGRPAFFSVVDIQSIVVLESFQHKTGEHIPSSSLASATQIKTNGKTVGYLILEVPPVRRDPREGVFLNRLDMALLIVAIGAIIISLIFGGILSRTITNPVRELTSATHAMAQGKLGQKVRVRSKDEIGELAESFNTMSSDLARAFDLRKQITADIAHELRTPLSLIIGHAEAVHDGVLPPSHENFEIIREEALRLEKLVNDLRTLSLADAGELSFEVQTVDVNQLLADLQSHYLHQFNRNHIALDLISPANHLLAKMDPDRFSQVITNILDNALHFTPENGRVYMQAEETDRGILVTIQDNESGVPPGEAGRLFDRFYRADPSRTRDEGGSGLGLAIAKSIIEMQKGKIWAESGTGRGLKICIEIPR